MIKGNIIKISIYNNLEDNMKFISWNVNGIRACVTKGFLDYFKEVDADIFCLQETFAVAGESSFQPPLCFGDRVSPCLELPD